MKNLIFLLLSFLFLSYFQNDADTLIRIKNTSQFDFKEVIYNPGSGEHNYGNIYSNQITDYKLYEYAYSYGLIELKIDGVLFGLYPIDYGG